MDYFENKLKLPSPEFCNPATFLMKCMNPEGLLVEKMQANRDFNVKYDENLQKQFKERLEFMVSSYTSSDSFKQLVPTLNEAVPVNKKLNQSPWLKEFLAILDRAFKNIRRSPMEVRAKFVATLVFTAVCIIVFEGVHFLFFS